MKHGYAQTILQLQVQLMDSGASDEELRSVADAYLLAADLFSGQYRGSGKTFVAHLVGTASILFAHRAPLVVTMAGLLHAAYDQGDFGRGLRDNKDARRREVRSVVGSAVENYVHGYSRLPWSDQSILACKIPAVLPERERNLLFIRLANELEDHLDFSAQFCRNRDKRVARMALLGGNVVTLARDLGQHELAEELAATFAENLNPNVPIALRSQYDSSFQQIPRSCGRRLTTRLKAKLSRLQRVPALVLRGQRIRSS